MAWEQCLEWKSVFEPWMVPSRSDREDKSQVAYSPIAPPPNLAMLPPPPGTVAPQQLSTVWHGQRRAKQTNVVTPAADPAAKKFLHQLSSEVFADQQGVDGETSKMTPSANLQRQLIIMAARVRRHTAAPMDENEQKLGAGLPVRLALSRFAVNDEEWLKSVTGPLNEFAKIRQDLDDVLEACWDSVMHASSVVYGIAKVFTAMCESFEIDLNTNPTGIPYKIQKVDDTLNTDSVIPFTAAIEDLYYALYARIVAELGHVVLASSFNLDNSEFWNRTSPALPEPNHLFIILFLFRQMLEDPSVCASHNQELLKFHQNAYITDMKEKHQNIHRLPDLVGYRRHIREMTRDRFSETFRTYITVYPMAREFPVSILTHLSEKYISLAPRMMSTGVATGLEPLPFVDLQNQDPVVWERNIIQAHRAASLALLQGMAVGEIRREEDNKCDLIDYVKEQKCVCTSICGCAVDCTKNAEILCPCANRWMRSLVIRDPDCQLDFLTRGDILGELTYQLVAAICRDTPDNTIISEIKGGIHLIREEMVKFRKIDQNTVLPRFI